MYNENIDIEWTATKKHVQQLTPILSSVLIYHGATMEQVSSGHETFWQ